MTRLLQWSQPIGAFGVALVVGTLLLLVPDLLQVICVMCWIALFVVIFRNLVREGLLQAVKPALRAMALRARNFSLTAAIPDPVAPQASSKPRPSSPPNPPKVGLGASTGRKQSLMDGIKGIEALQGLDDVRHHLEDLLDATEHSSALRGRMAGLSQGTVFVISGPRGTGRATVTVNLAKIMFGLGLTKTDQLSMFPPDRGRGLSAGDLYGLIASIADDFHDTVVVFEEAEWLLEPDAAAVGRALSDAARRTPGRFWIVMIGSQGFGRRFKGSPEPWTAWQKAFAMRDIPFTALEDPHISAILDSHIAKSGTDWSQTVRKRFIRAIDEARGTLTYANAITVRQLFEATLQASVTRNRGGTTSVIAEIDIDRAVQQLTH